jgi:PST family polysaccharide transporter
MRVGADIWAAGNLSYLVDAANRLIIGRFLGIGDLGFYEVTSRLVHFPLQTLIGIHDRVAVPAFCREQEDLARLREWFFRVTSLMTVLTALVAGTLFFLADQLIPVVFGPRWASAIGPARALAPFALVLPLLSVKPVFIARGRTRLALRFTMVRAVTTVLMLVVAAQISLLAVCAAESLAACIFAPINLVLIARFTRMSPTRILAAFDLPATGLAAFSVVAIITRALLWKPAAVPDLFTLAALAAPPVIAFAAAVFARRPRIVAEIREIAAAAFGPGT